MPEVKLRSGFLIPDPDAVRKVTKQLASDLQRDSTLATAFKKDPRRVLGSRGLPGDVQVEMLRELGRRGTLLKCYLTCVCTTCCSTKVSRIDARGRIVPIT